jgi:hypothetical protein
MPPLATLERELGDAIARIPVTRVHLTTPTDIDTDDDVLADLLFCMWALASGRFLSRGVRPDQLSEDELINFWADDFTPAVGRHAAGPPDQHAIRTAAWSQPAAAGCRSAPRRPARAYPPAHNHPY